MICGTELEVVEPDLRSRQGWGLTRGLKATREADETNFRALVNSPARRQRAAYKYPVAPPPSFFEAAPFFVSSIFPPLAGWKTRHGEPLGAIRHILRSASSL
jgi:hypothetical protein